MKKQLSIFLVFILIITALFGCSDNKKTPEDTDGKLVVYTSFYPMYDFASKIAGDKAVVYNMVPAGTEPHDWEPTTKDIVNLENANMFIYSGLDMEHWVSKVLDSLENENLIVLEASEGIASRGTDNNIDPHIWLSVAKAKQQMENIKTAFTKADPENADYYEENYSKYAAEFEELDNRFKDELSALPNNTIVVAHEAFGYLCDEYGLIQVGIEGLNSESEPDPEKMSEIIKFARDNNVTTIFYEELDSSKLAEVVAKEIGADTAALNPLEGLTQEQIDSGEDYLSIMQGNLEALIKALS